MNIIEELIALKDDKNSEFQAKLTPGVDKEKFLGVRVPDARKLAKRICKADDAANLINEFMNTLPHDYFDENMLHALLISEMKDYEACIKEIDKFLPYVDNWAVCDIMSPKMFKKHKDKLIEKIRLWSASEETYTCRFGMEMLMSFYLDDDFEQEYLNIPAAVHSDEYYVNMMIAWFFATALAKQWDATVGYIENNCLDTWVHNKTIQKARESYRITPEQKEYLKGLKRK